MLDLRMACLERRRQELSALTQLLAAADAKVVENAAQAAAEQTSLATCADGAAVVSRGRLPADAALRARIEAVPGRDPGTGQGARRHAGKLLEALPVARAAAEQARALHHPATLAEALVAKAFVHQQLRGRRRRPRPPCRRQSPAALEGHHEEMLATAFAQARLRRGRGQSHFDEGARWARVRRATLSALGPG